MRSFRWLCPLVCVGIVAAVAVTGAATPSTPTATLMPAALQHRHDPIKNRHRRDDGISESSNWSGYAVTPTAPISEVMGSWTVPTLVACSAKGDQYSSFWVGIDGWSSSTVEQTGTDSDCIRGKQSYYAWYEFYPKSSYSIGMTVSPGNSMTATVTYAGNGSFTVFIKDISTGQSFTTSSVVKTAARSSAEWIAEAPSGAGGVLTLADFGTVKFSGSQAQATGGTLGSISSFFESPNPGLQDSQFVQETVMVQKNGDGAQPNALDSTGTKFTDMYEPAGSFSTTKQSSKK